MMKPSGPTSRTDGALPDAEAPSGTQIELRLGDQQAYVVEVGGALRAYVTNAGDRLDGYGRADRCTGARGQTFIPWPNRLRHGRYRLGATEHQLPLSEPARQNAIHGLVRWANWSPAEVAADRARMTYVLHPQPGWPFTLGLSIAYRLDSDGLSVTTTATNLGSEPCPYGTGAHPYLRLRAPSIDQLQLQAPGSAWMPSDEHGIPTGLEPVDSTAYDFRRPRTIGSATLDTAYGSLQRDHDGLAWVTLVDPATGDGVKLWMDDAYPYLMLFSGDTLPQEDRRRRGLGVEPMSCAPNALQSGHGLVVIEPGGLHTARWGIRP